MCVPDSIITKRDSYAIKMFVSNDFSFSKKVRARDVFFVYQLCLSAISFFANLFLPHEDPLTKTHYNLPKTAKTGKTPKLKNP